MNNAELNTTEGKILHHWKSVESSKDPRDPVSNAYSIANIAKLVNDTGIDLANLDIDVPRYQKMLEVVQQRAIKAKEQLRLNRQVPVVSNVESKIDRKDIIDRVRKMWEDLCANPRGKEQLIREFSSLSRLICEHKISFEESGITPGKLGEIIKSHPDISAHISLFDFQSKVRISYLVDKSIHPEEINIDAPHSPRRIYPQAQLEAIPMNAICYISDLFRVLKPFEALVCSFGSANHQKFYLCESVQDVAWIYKNCGGMTAYINWKKIPNIQIS